ncbi:hypothetical protein Tco_0979672 [Tanacetum coccineum]
MEPGINNMTLNEYLMYEGKHKELEKGYTSRISVAPKRNRILVYPNSNEGDEEYFSLPPLLPCFQTPQPCATFNSVHHNSHNEVDIDNMTLEEYARYELTMSSKRSELDNPTLGSENIRKMKYEVPNRCDDEIVDIIDYEDSDQEDGQLPDLPTLSATNVFASIYKQVKDDIDISITKEKEEVQVEDVQMDEDYDIDHSNTLEMLQWSFTNDPFLVLTSRGWNSRSSRLVLCSKVGAEIQQIYAFGISFLAAIQVEVCGVMLGRSLATGKHFKTRLVGYHVDDDDETICDNGCCSKKQTWSMAQSMLSLHHTEQI